MKILKISGKFALSIILLISLFSCDDQKSYSELLDDEEHACNWYLAKHSIITEIPTDSIFETGENAPYYKMDKGGNVYMKVIKIGDGPRAKTDDRIYFTFMRMSINYTFEGNEEIWVGNSEDLGNGVGSTYFFFNNQTFTSSTQYGDGIQLPLKYLPLNSEVELVIKSVMGFTSDISSCTAYVYKVRYFPAIY